MASYNWLVSRGVDASRIIITGHSLGTGVATDLAKRLETEGRPYAGLLLLSAYASIGDAAIGYGTLPILRPIRGIPFLEDLVKSAMVDKWMSYVSIRAVTRPTLIIHGLDDWDISPWQSQALFLETSSARANESWIDGHWKLRGDQHLLDGKISTIKSSEGEIWTYGDVTLLQVAHAGHNSLSKFLIVEDAILNFE
jgi:acetyl esterase/lipase